MTKLTNEQIESILEGAPDGATHYDIDGKGYIKVTESSTFDFYKGKEVDGGYLEPDRNLSDLRKILEQDATILALRKEVASLKEEMAAKEAEVEVLREQRHYFQVEYMGNVLNTFLLERDAVDYNEKFGGVYSVKQTSF